MRLHPLCLVAAGSLLLPSAAGALSITLQRLDSSLSPVGPQSTVTVAPGTTGTARIDDASLGIPGLEVDADTETKPNLPPGGLGLPDALELSSGIDATNNSGESVIFSAIFSESDYALSPETGAVRLDASGNFGNFVSDGLVLEVDTWIDTDNAEFAGPTAQDITSDALRVGDRITLSSALASDTTRGSVTTDGPFSVSQRAIVQLVGNGSGDAAFDTSAEAVPAPAALWLMLSGLGGLAFLQRRRRA